jgi:hypothetical protein
MAASTAPDGFNITRMIGLRMIRAGGIIGSRAAFGLSSYVNICQPKNPAIGASSALSVRSFKNSSFFVHSSVAAGVTWGASISAIVADIAV